jgi:hypothetical protein
MAQSGASPLQSACNSGAAARLPDTLAIPDRFDMALVANVAQRLRGGAFRR